MRRAALTLSCFISTIFFPWPFTAFLAAAVAISEPLVPLAAGIFADTLYYSSAAASLPTYAIGGAILTLVAFLVRSRLSASIIN